MGFMGHGSHPGCLLMFVGLMEGSLHHWVKRLAPKQRLLLFDPPSRRPVWAPVKQWRHRLQTTKHLMKVLNCAISGVEQMVKVSIHIVATMKMSTKKLHVNNVSINIIYVYKMKYINISVHVFKKKSNKNIIRLSVRGSGIIEISPLPDWRWANRLAKTERNWKCSDLQTSGKGLQKMDVSHFNDQPPHISSFDPPMNTPWIVIQGFTVESHWTKHPTHCWFQKLLVLSKFLIILATWTEKQISSKILVNNSFKKSAWWNRGLKGPPCKTSTHL